MAEFVYLEMMVTNQINMHKEIKSRLNVRNALCHSVRELLSSRLWSKNIND
jgi:hypothetical protein